MPAVCLSFKVHIPYRLKKIRPGAGTCGDYFDMAATNVIVDQFADNCYLPANAILLKQIRKQPQRFKLAFSISGTALELFRDHRPDVLRSFLKLAKTGCVEFYAETYYHSLSWLYSKPEFERQVQKHHRLLQELLGTEPSVLRNTELVYNNELARHASAMGYKAMLCEGLQKWLGERTPNQVYAAPGNGDFGLLLRHARLSDDIAFRFDDPCWNEQPLTAEKFAGWLHGQPGDPGVTNLFFDYETFGIHKKKSSGIFDFLEHLPAAVLAGPSWQFLGPAEVTDQYYPRDIYDVPHTSSWEGKERESCVWNENRMQNNTLHKIYSIESMVKQTNIPGAMECWGRLQSADHFHYMCREQKDTGDHYRAMNPFQSSEAAYENYRNAVMDLEIRLIQQGLNDIRIHSYREQRTANLYSSIY